MIHIRVGIFGDAGSGKSTLCNVVSGESLSNPSAVFAGTRAPQEFSLGANVTLIDFPGTGEDIGRHQEYLALYEKLMPEIDIAFFCFKADDRKYLSSIDSYKIWLKAHHGHAACHFVITNCDKIPPNREWDDNNNCPTSDQMENLNNRMADLQRRFKIRTRPIMVSSSRNWGINRIHAIIQQTVETLEIWEMMSRPRVTLKAPT